MKNCNHCTHVVETVHVVQADQLRCSKTWAHSIVAQLIVRERSRLKCGYDIQLWPPKNSTLTLDEQLARLQTYHERLSKVRR